MKQTSQEDRRKKACEWLSAQGVTHPLEQAVLIRLAYRKLQDEDATKQ